MGEPQPSPNGSRRGVRNLLILSPFLLVGSYVFAAPQEPALTSACRPKRR
jgi:hypothetical protein